MTLCIAALSREKGTHEPLAVVSFDMRIETWHAGSETGFKLDTLSARWYVLLAGEIATGKELVAAYRSAIRSIEKNDPDRLSDATIIDELYRPLHAVRYSRADRLTHTKHAMSYDEFLRNGQAYLPEDLFRQTSYEVASQALDAEMIFIGLHRGRIKLYKLSSGNINRSEPFAVIGSGTSVAESSLYQREVSGAWEVPETLYAVYEAQRLGRIAPGVGRLYDAAIVSTNDAGDELYPNVINDSTRNFLDKCYDELGQKQIGELTLPSDPFIDFSSIKKP